MEKNLHISALLDVYGAFLGENIGRTLRKLQKYLRDTKEKEG